MKCGKCGIESEHNPCYFCLLESQLHKPPCPYLNTDNLTCSHPDIPFYDIICSQEICPNA